jgi:hypothetical protein
MTDPCEIGLRSINIERAEPVGRAAANIEEEDRPAGFVIITRRLKAVALAPSCHPTAFVTYAPSVGWGGWKELEAHCG